MSEVTVTKVLTPYELTVNDAVICFLVKEGVYDKKILRVPEIKSIKIMPDTSAKKIYASGKVRDVTASTKGAKAELDVIALPPAFVNKASGVQGAGDAKYEVSLPQLPEFGFGYWCDNSDGSQVYYWHPRCKLTLSDEEHKTSDDGDIDPSVKYAIEIMPTDEGVWKGKYDCRTIEGVKLTPEEFYKKLPYTKAEFDAIKQPGG